MTKVIPFPKRHANQAPDVPTPTMIETVYTFADYYGYDIDELRYDKGQLLAFLVDVKAWYDDNRNPIDSETLVRQVASVLYHATRKEF